MKKIPSASAASSTKRAGFSYPKFGPEPVPQPVGGRFALPMRAAVVRRKPAIALRPRREPGFFVFIRTPKTLLAPKRSAARPVPPRKTAIRRASRVAIPVAETRPEPVASTISVSKQPVSVGSDIRHDPPALPQVSQSVRYREVAVVVPSIPPIPAILLEGDFPAAPVELSSTTRFAPGASAVVPPLTSPASASKRAAVIPDLSKSPEPSRAPALALPASPAPPRAGVWLSARDSRCLLLGWSADRAWLRSYADAFTAGAWEWRMRMGSTSGPVVAAGPLPADRDFHFVTVPAGASFHGEVGFRHADGGWMSIGISLPVGTPAEQVQDHFASPPTLGAFGSVAPVDFGTGRRSGFPAEFRAPVPHRAATPDGFADWSQKAEGAIPVISDEVFEEILWGHVAEGTIGGSSEALASEVSTTRVLTRQTRRAMAVDAGTAPSEEQPSSAELATDSPTPAHDFWFKVNAELVIHGSTEADAKVSIAGRPVRLRPDGSFSFRFSLPDGRFVLPVLAVSARGDDGRSAELVFGRHTEMTGLVGVHPIDSSLRPPVPETIR